MPDRYIPVSESEQQFAMLLERVLTEPSFAEAMDSDPVQALNDAGYDLDGQQVEAIRASRRFEQPEVLGDDQLAFPLTKPLVSIITKGTKPAVRVVTKGTQPAVSVAVNTVVLVEESTLPEIEVVPAEEERFRAAPADEE
ncbi:hypothetical protein [Kribbella sp. NPDC004875]|uniref:hypothetical protein n=1 Tax=Kribbella sp. NPDC004875 TaxID=3364107 RepID=UPI0036895831